MSSIASPLALRHLFFRSHQPAAADSPPAACALPAWQEYRLAPDQGPQLLRVSRGACLLLQAGQGRVWLTCEGRPDDHFLSMPTTDGHAPLSITGPARLRIGAAVAREPAVLRWRQLPA